MTPSLSDNPRRLLVAAIDPDRHLVVSHKFESTFTRKAETKALGKAEYIRQNPVRAGLTSSADDWPYVLDRDGLEKMAAR